MVCTRNFSLFSYLVVSGVLLIGVGEAREPRHASGNHVQSSAFKSARAWPNSVHVDPRCEFVVPINVVRIYSNRNSAERIAPKKWLIAGVELANRMFRFKEAEMRPYSRSRPAPCLQFRIRSWLDVHEDEVSKILGKPFDTESLLGAGPQSHNGPRKTNTMDLRTLKVTDGTSYLTLFCVYAIKNPKHQTLEIGGESNVGAAPGRSGPRAVLTRVTNKRAFMGVVMPRREAAYMNNVAHEFGHYFNLPHAWDRGPNIQRGLRDLGGMDQGKVDPHPRYGNCMDYDNGPGVMHYFTRSQLNHMYKFARDRARNLIRIEKPGPTTPITTVVKKPAGRFVNVRADRPSAAGPVTVHAKFQVDHLKDKTGQLVFWFSDKNGQKLRDADNTYRSVDGQVSILGDFKPIYEKTTFNDYALTLPAGQLHLGPGRHTVTVAAGIFYNGALLHQSKSVSFEYFVPNRRVRVEERGTPAAWITAANVVEHHMAEGEPWVKIDCKLTLDHLSGETVELQGRYFFSDGTQLKDFDNVNRSPDGMAWAMHKIVPKGGRRATMNKTLWMPHKELHLRKGSHRMYASLSLVHKGRTLATRTTGVFTVDRGVPRPKEPRKIDAKATFERVWTTHNEFKGGEKGMTVHARVRIKGKKNRRLTVISWFWSSDAKRLKDFDNRYKTQDGQVCSTLDVTPIYDDTIFHDVQMFIPYSQLHLAKGFHKLGATVAVFDGNQRLGIKNDLVRFDVTQN